MYTQYAKRSLHSLYLLLIITTLGGCASNYQSKQLFGGYSEEKLLANVFEVSFKGNGFTKRDRVTDFALLRSAEVAVENGFDYFVVIDQKLPGRSKPHTSPLGFSDTSAQHEPGRAPSSGQVYNISDPVTTNTIACFEEKPEGMTSYNALHLIKNLKSKYQIVGASGQS